MPALPGKKHMRKVCAYHYSTCRAYSQGFEQLGRSSQNLVSQNMNFFRKHKNIFYNFAYFSMIEYLMFFFLSF